MAPSELTCLVLVALNRLIYHFETTHSDSKLLATEFFAEQTFSAEKSFGGTVDRNSRHTFDKPLSTEKEKASNAPKTAAMQTNQ